MMFSDRVKENLKREFLKNKLAKVCLIALVIITLSSIFIFLSPYDPNRIELTEKLQDPSLKHIFGTDSLGRDYFTRAMYGTRISLTVGILSMLVSVFIGTLVGAISGLIGGN